MGYRVSPLHYRLIPPRSVVLKVLMIWLLFGLCRMNQLSPVLSGCFVYVTNTITMPILVSVIIKDYVGIELSFLSQFSGGLSCSEFRYTSKLMLGKQLPVIIIISVWYKRWYVILLSCTLVPCTEFNTRILKKPNPKRET